MTRTIAPALSVALTREIVKPVFLFEMEFISSTLRLSNLPYDITWNSVTWLGNGMLRDINNVQEDMQLAPTSCVVDLGVLDSGLMSLLLGSTNQSKKGYVYVGAFNSTGSTLLGAFLAFKGFFETVSIIESAQGALAQVVFENDLIKLNRPNEVRYTDQSQQALFPGDLGFQYVAAAEDWKGFWGKAPKVKRIRKRKLNQGTK